jgi:hypothetical protein
MKQVLLGTTAAVALLFGAWGAAAQTDRADQLRTPSAAAPHQPPAAERGEQRDQGSKAAQTPQGEQQRGQAQKAPPGQQHSPQAQPSQPRDTAQQHLRREPGVAGTQTREAQPGQDQNALSAAQRDDRQSQPGQPRDTAQERERRGPGAAATRTREAQPGQAQNAPSGTQQQNGQAQPSQPRPTASGRDQREPGSAGSANAPTAQRSERAGGGVNTSVAIPQQQRAELNQRLATVNLHRAGRVNFSLSVGTVVPRDVRLYPLPVEIAAVVPAFRGYEYIAVGDRIAIVEPRSLRIVTIIDQRGAGEGFTGSAAPPRGALVIPERTRVVIRERIHTVALQRAPRHVTFRLVVGGVVPAAVPLYVMPPPIVEIDSDLRPYRYVVVEQQLVIVEPKARKIIAILPI